MSQNLAQASSLLPKILYSGQLADAADHALYTVPAAAAAIVKSGVVTNVSAAPVTVTVAVVPSGGAADGTHRVVSTYSLAAGDSISLADYLEGACLGPGDAIHAQAGTAAALDLLLTGVEVS